MNGKLSTYEKEAFYSTLDETIGCIFLTLREIEERELVRKLNEMGYTVLYKEANE